jgi:hypothetical protein
MPDKAIKEFKKLYFKEYGINLSNSQAESLAYTFLKLFSLVNEK